MNNKIELGGIWLPRQLSTFAKDIDWAWDVVTWVSVFFFVGIVGAMSYFVWKYRRRGPNDKVSPIAHSNTIEVIWTVLPSMLVISLFFVGFKGYLNASVPEAEALEIHATAEKWRWVFTYPNGTSSLNELRVPVDRPVRVLLSSAGDVKVPGKEPVLHSFFIPEFRVKQDAIPGTYTSVWFRATAVAETTLLCTEYCGTGHSDMIAKVIIMDQAKYDDWLQNGGEDGNAPPAELGKKLYAEKSCNSCHSLDGTAMTGPTYKGIFGRKEKMTDGTEITVNENYLRESILQPGAKIVAGYQNQMPAFQGLLSDKQVTALIEFIKTQK